MRVLITGADRALGRLAARAFREAYDLRLTGTAAEPPADLGGIDYLPADLREPGVVAPLVAGCDAVLHLAPYDLPADAEADLLDHAARGTFVLLHAALAAGVRRVVLASRLEVMAAYPANLVVTPAWAPRPEATAAALAPFVAELTLREFVRAEEIVGVCLRFGPLDGTAPGTTPADAIAALDRALRMELGGRKYRWWLYHIDSTGRFPLDEAWRAPLEFQPTAGGN